jgi:hypothetical protein
MKPLFSRLNAWKKPDEDEEYLNFLTRNDFCINHQRLKMFYLFSKDLLIKQLIHFLKSLKLKKVRQKHIEIILRLS